MKKNSSTVDNCGLYLEEYTECQKLIHKFYHYYTFGHFRNINCEQSKNNYIDCILWCKFKDLDAKKRLQESIQQKFEHIKESRTKVWTYRTDPPEMWHSPGNLRYAKD